MFRKVLLSLIAIAAVGGAPTVASARGGFGFHGGGFHGGFAGGGWHRGFGPAFAGGLITGAVIGGLASSAYAWEPGYGYYDGYAPAYYPGPDYGYYGYRSCPEPGYGAYYNCGGYAVPGYGY